MFLALGITLPLPDWSGGGSLLPTWFIFVQMLLGTFGAWVAWRTGFLGWAIASRIWGKSLVPVLLVLTTFVSDG